MAPQLKTGGCLVQTNNNDDKKSGNNVSNIGEVFCQLLIKAERNIVSSDILLALLSLPTLKKLLSRQWLCPPLSKSISKGPTSAHQSMSHLQTG